MLCIRSACLTRSSVILTATLADIGLILVQRLLRDEIVGIGLLGGLHDLLVGRARQAVPNVLLDRALGGAHAEGSAQRTAGSRSQHNRTGLQRIEGGRGVSNGAQQQPWRTREL